MSNLVDHCTTVETVLESQSLGVAKTMFDFENVPNSTIDSTYKYLVSDTWDEDENGGVWKIATFDIEVAYTVVRGNFTKTIEKAKVAVAKNIEKAFYAEGAFCSYDITFGFSFEEFLGGTTKVIKLMAILTLRYRTEITT